LLKKFSKFSANFMKFSENTPDIENGPIKFHVLLTRVVSDIDPGLCEAVSRHSVSRLANFGIEKSPNLLKIC